MSAANRILLAQANALYIPLADNSVHCVVTSPPYYHVRDYGVDGQLGLETLHDCLAWARGESPCGACYVCSLRAVFAEVRRVLRPDGVLWMNLGDSYNGSGGAGGDYADGGRKEGQPRYPGNHVPGLKEKDMIGVPWRVALALQADGWWLRAENIWHKNSMPESVTDRPTRVHEHVFLLAKSARYFYDVDAIRQPYTTDPAQYRRAQQQAKSGKHLHTAQGGKDTTFSGEMNPAGRNRTTVWAISASRYNGAHFATYPPALVEVCVKAGTSEKGVCPACGAQWERMVEAVGGTIGKSWTDHTGDIKWGKNQPGVTDLGRKDLGNGLYRRIQHGWQPTCACDAGDPVPATVFDPFNGAATTGLTSRRLGRRYVGIDLSMPYLRQSQDRLGLTALAQWMNGGGDDGSDEAEAGASVDYGPLFGGAA